MPPKAKAERITDTTSSGAGRGLETFWMRAVPSARAPSAIGSTRMNIQRQSR